MTCDEVLRVIDPYLDGELSVVDTLEAHEHFERCETCRRIFESEAALHTRLTQAIRGEDVPAGLRSRIRGRIEGAAPFRIGRRRRLIARLALLASAVAVAGLGWLVIDRIAFDHLSPLTAELASKHLLYTERPGAGLEIVTSEPSRMGTWLEGRLGFPIKLAALDQRPERLIGGRISSVADVPAGYVLYDRGGRPISLFVTRRVPVAKRGWTERHVDGAELYVGSLRGIALVWWEDERADRLYAAASTADAEELVEFARICISGTRDSQLNDATPADRRGT